MRRGKPWAPGWLHSGTWLVPVPSPQTASMHPSSSQYVSKSHPAITVSTDSVRPREVGALATVTVAKTIPGPGMKTTRFRRCQMEYPRASVHCQRRQQAYNRISAACFLSMGLRPTCVEPELSREMKENFNVCCLCVLIVIIGLFSTW